MEDEQLFEAAIENDFDDFDSRERVMKMVQVLFMLIQRRLTLIQRRLTLNRNRQLGDLMKQAKGLIVFLLMCEFSLPVFCFSRMILDIRVYILIL